MKTLLSPTPALGYAQGRVPIDMLHSAQVLNVLVLLPYLIFCFFFRTLPMEGTVYGLKHLLVLEVRSFRRAAQLPTIVSCTSSLRETMSLPKS